MLVRNDDGVLGHVGEGVVWGMNWLTESGACCFNPIKESDLLWSVVHNCYLRKGVKDHFKFPIILGQFYIFKDGKKIIDTFPKLDVPMLHETYQYFTEFKER